MDAGSTPGDDIAGECGGVLDPECALPLVPPGARRTAAIETALVNTIGFGSKNAALVVRRAGAT